MFRQWAFGLAVSLLSAPVLAETQPPAAPPSPPGDEPLTKDGADTTPLWPEDDPFTGKKHVARALIESGTLLTIGLFWYYVDFKSKHNVEQFPFTLKTYIHKLTDLDYTRFDTSSAFHNTIGHSLIGNLYYNTWRSNGFSWLKSLLLTTLINVTWEYVVEYREIASINDLIITSGAGLTLGESTHQFALSIFQGLEPGLVTGLAGFINPFEIVNWTIDGQRRDPKHLGSPLRQIDLKAGAGVSYLHSRNRFYGGVDLALDSTIFTGPRRDRPRSSWLGNAPLTELRLAAIMSTKGPSRFQLAAKNAMFGHLWQAPSARSFAFLGASSALMYENHPLDAHKDYYATVGIFGPSTYLRLRHGKLDLQFIADVYPGFTIIHSFAVDRYGRTHDLSGTKTTLRQHGYYYAYGPALRGELRLRRDALEVGGRGRYIQVWSFNGRDRFQRDVTNDFSLSDRRSFASAWISWRIAPRLKVSFAYERYGFQGKIAPLVQRDTEHRLILWAAFVPFL